MERRDDLGVKIIYGVVAFILSLFLGFCWSQANAGLLKATLVSERVVRIETCFEAMTSDISEIKEILKQKFVK